MKVLVLCTGNSARSILGEMLFKHLGQGRVTAYSAGSRPSRKVNPVAIETLQRHGIPCAGARSKSWDEFAAPGAPEFDFIFTVCANAANETCPVWPGHPATAHWGIPDPAHVEPMEARREAFEEAYQALKKRIEAFLVLPLESMTPQESALAARRIHEESGHHAPPAGPPQGGRSQQSGAGAVREPASPPPAGRAPGGG